MVTLSLKLKDYFFDRRKVLAALAKAEVKNLSKAGAFVRRRARSSLRRRKRPSLPGSPPSVHSRDENASLKKIIFAYDPFSRSVIVGPVKLNGSSLGVVVPGVLEHGGASKIREVKIGRRWFPAGMRAAQRFRARGQPTRIRRIEIRPRPFMAPALAAELPKFPGLWAGSVS